MEIRGSAVNSITSVFHTMTAMKEPVIAEALPLADVAAFLDNDRRFLSDRAPW
jgi:hypothetical protein